MAAQKQLDLFWPEYVKVDGLKDSTGQIEYWGQAQHIRDDLYECIANIGGTMCRVEIRVKFPAPPR